MPFASKANKIINFGFTKDKENIMRMIKLVRKEKDVKFATTPENSHTSALT